MESAAATKPRLWGWLALICVLLFVAAVRIRLRDMPLERDEGEFAYGGQLLLQGVPPGRLLYTLKLPGTHAAYAALMFLFGQSNAGVHLGFLLVNAATIVLLFLLARVLLGNVAASIAAATFGLLSLSPGVLGTSAHATHFVVLMAVAGLWWLWRAANTGRRLAYLGAGAMLGASVLMKHNGLMFVALALGWLVALGYTKQFAPSPPLGKALLFFATGVATPLLLFGVLLWWAGTWENSWFWSVKYAQAYAKPNPSFTLTWLNLMQRMPAVLVIPFYFAVTGAVVLWLRRESRSVALFATSWLALSLLAVVPGLHLRPHYYVLLIPVISFLVGALAQQITGLLAGSRIKFLAVAPTAVFVILFACGIAREQSFLFQQDALTAGRTLYGQQPFPEAIVLADYIRTNSTASDRIAVLGSEPEIYFHARRQSATGFVYTYPLSENQPFAETMRRQMQDEIAAAQPKFVVQVRTWTSWLTRPSGLKRIDQLCASLMPPHYRLVAACEVFPENGTVKWHWPPEPIATPPGDTSQLLLYERAATNQSNRPPTARP